MVMEYASRARSFCPARHHKRRKHGAHTKGWRLSSSQHRSPISPPAMNRLAATAGQSHRQDIFLKALAACGCVSDACRSVGMSREWVRLRAVQPPRRRRFSRRLGCGARLRDPPDRGAGERWDGALIKGVSRPDLLQGRSKVGEYRHYDERLAHVTLLTLSPADDGVDRDLPLPPGYPPARAGREWNGSRPRRGDRQPRLAPRRRMRRRRPSWNPAASAKPHARMMSVNRFVDNFVGNDADQDRHAELGSASDSGQRQLMRDPDWTLKRIQGDVLPSSRLRAFA